MDSFPAFHDPSKFPAFSIIPLASQDPDSTIDTITQDDVSQLSSPYDLIGTISENMTLGTNPTFICKDRDMSPFAVTIKLEPSGQGVKFDVKSCKKGHTMTIHKARKYGVKDGKQGFVETTPGQIKIIPASVETLIGLSSVKDSLSAKGDEKADLRHCQACSEEKSSEELSRCKGCESVWYCDKNCQTTGWNDRGHKTYCKILRAVRGLGGK